MLEKFPNHYEDVYEWSWSDWQPYYQYLIDYEVTVDSCKDWLSDWSRVQRLNNEISRRMSVAKDVDTNDEKAEAHYKHFMATIFPEVKKVTFELNKKLVAAEGVPDELLIPLRSVQAQIELFHEANLPLMVKLNDLRMRYSKLRGSQTVEWDGEEVTLTALQSVLNETDRDRRQSAWLLMQDRLTKDRDAFDELWVEYMQIRKAIYQNSGYADFREYAWKDRRRFDYTPADSIAFTEAIENVVVPAAHRLRQAGQKQLGYESLRPWDMLQHSFGFAIDPLGRESIIPYESMQDLIDKSAAVFAQVDDEIGQFFATMRDESLLDLDNRKGKAPGGYCTQFEVSKRPFIFMNAVSSEGDVRTLLHEAGHAFHVFEMSKLNYHQQGGFMFVPMEFAEVGSMAMELLASPYLGTDSGGYFDEDSHNRFRANHLRNIIYFWPYMSVVVAFQHWIYTNHDAATDPKACDQKWLELWKRFIPGINWDGYEEYITNRWRLQGHIFSAPFYYIEYGLAQLGAVQIWANALESQADALAQYRHALQLGGTVSLPQLFEAAGAKLAFDGETLQNAVELIESHINQYDPA